MRIHKYEFPAAPGQYHIRLPLNSRIVSAALKSGMIAVWAEVEPSARASAVRVMHVLPTGYTDVPDHARFVATILDQDLVWHVYEQAQRADPYAPTAERFDQS